MAIPLNDLIALNAVVLVLVIGLTAARCWIFRKQPKSIASVASDVSLLGFSGVIVTIAGIELNNTFREIKIREDLMNEFGKIEEMDLFVRLATDEYLKHAFACMVMYTTQLFLLKVAYLGYFVLLKQHFTKHTVWLLNGTIVYTVLGFIVAMTVQLTICLPVSRNWAPGPDACVGLSTVTGSTVQAWTNLSADILILAIAIITVSSLQLGRQERTALVCVVILGSVSPLICLVRFVQVYKTAVNPPQGSPLPVLKDIYLYGKFEVLFGHIAFCLPALRVLWRRVEATRKSRSQSHSNSTGASRSYRKSIGLPKKMSQHDEISLDDMESQKGLRVDDSIGNANGSVERLA